VSRVTRWVVAAVIGLALAVALTFATLQLTTQHVGLAGEPPAVGRGLVPPRATPAPTATPTPTHTTATPATASGDDRGEDGGRGAPDD